MITPKEREVHPRYAREKKIASQIRTRKQRIRKNEAHLNPDANDRSPNKHSANSHQRTARKKARRPRGGRRGVDSATSAPARQALARVI